MIAYHATSKSALEKIMKNGFLKEKSYWAVDEKIHEYYLETITDDGEVPVSIVINISDLNIMDLSPDIQGIEEPLTYTLGKTEEEVWKEWVDSTQTWKDCIQIIGSFVYNKTIPVEILEIQENLNYSLK